jgi:large subunit ribosomal protein L7e
VFVRINKASSNLLRRVEPYITFGYPTRETIRKLVYKRGFGKVNRQRIPLSNNLVVSESLGKHGIESVEDLINEIYNVGPHFK